jgi:hypothetical protein
MGSTDSSREAGAVLTLFSSIGKEIAADREASFFQLRSMQYFPFGFDAGIRTHLASQRTASKFRTNKCNN